ncbi:ferritin-like domain-containing protein [Nocardia sp. NPDC005366]|uniref:ferritin n=1 Tax=Nocardia sp. NPDC005366 TaxID=3156878 RepID=UPI0033B03D88
MSETDVSFTILLRDQIRQGLTVAQQYLAAAVYFDSRRLPRLGAHCYARSSEHRGDALRMIQYLLDRDVEVRVGGLNEVRSDFDSPRAAVAYLLEVERAGIAQITNLARSARETSDYLGEGFVQWFLKEQLENVADMTRLLSVIDRADDALFDVEDFIARESPSVRHDSTAPKMAGAAGK